MGDREHVVPVLILAVIGVLTVSAFYYPPIMPLSIVLGVFLSVVGWAIYEYFSVYLLVSLVVGLFSAAVYATVTGICARHAGTERSETVPSMLSRDG